ncbi:TPA_exp: Uncharacterized protein A8136_5493 [Trichophyton benhamiae CBS 112371]|nr:TPA_exp: Uncharacterized protein A8136_5493 [Trichophyton benhamiae CBS 112371]
MKRTLLRGEISYSSAKDKEVNILHRLEYPEKQNQFITDLVNREQWIKGVVAHHLNITSAKCHVADPHGWLWGSFNLCIPVTIHNWIREQPGNRVLLRLPLPYKVGESFRPGNMDEKIRCEASTYAWLEENHPHIPIPRLYGFSLSSGESSNIFVDQQWNITSLVDLEWGCSLPVEMIHPPYWLTSEFADAIDEDEYKKMWTEFVRILAQEEESATKQQHNYSMNNTRLSTIMTKTWEMGTLWYSLALRSPAAIFRLFLDRIQTKLGKDNYSNEEYGLVMAFQWRSGIGNILAQKIKDREAYDADLRRAFLPSETSDP